MALKSVLIFVALLCSAHCNPFVAPGQATVCETTSNLSPMHSTTTVCESQNVGLPNFGMGLPYPGVGATVCETANVGYGLGLGLPYQNYPGLPYPYHPYPGLTQYGLGSTSVCESAPNYGINANPLSYLGMGYGVNSLGLPLPYSGMDYAGLPVNMALGLPGGRLPVGAATLYESNYLPGFGVPRAHTTINGVGTSPCDGAANVGLGLGLPFNRFL